MAMPFAHPHRKLTFKQRMRRGRACINKVFPVGTRLILGLLLMVGGAFGFLPILGFWMIPLGISIAALDTRLLRRKVRKWWQG